MGNAMKASLAGLAMIVLLGGCVESGARAIGAATYTADKLSDYVRETHDLRLWVRSECREILEDEVKALVAKGETKAARELLRANYPELVTVNILQSISEEGSSPLSEPFGCD